MKKKFNWLGWLMITLYVMMIILWVVLGVFLNNNGYIELVYISYSITLIAMIAAAVLFPIWYNWAFEKILPIQKCIATVVNRQVFNSFMQENKYHYIVFDLNNGERLRFLVKKENYFNLYEGEQGLLTYKHQGEHMYFVAFER